MKVFEAEIEVVRLYTVKFRAEKLESAIDTAKGLVLDVQEIEELGENIDHETNLVSVSRQIGRKMYQ